jgi:hypothetical protein
VRKPEAVKVQLERKHSPAAKGFVLYNPACQKPVQIKTAPQTLVQS